MTSLMDNTNRLIAYGNERVVELVINQTKRLNKIKNDKMYALHTALNLLNEDFAADFILYKLEDYFNDDDVKFVSDIFKQLDLID